MLHFAGSSMNNLKQQLYDFCQDYVAQKIATIQSAIHDAQVDVREETKSSAGDKYETGRAMMHLEMEKLSGQLNEFLKIKSALDHIDIHQESLRVQPGSLVQTSIGNYFISISAGISKQEGKDFFCISPASPIGVALLGKTPGDTFAFRQQEGKIRQVG
jgi:transcription elongation GreA/GreB family factor